MICEGIHSGYRINFWLDFFGRFKIGFYVHVNFYFILNFQFILKSGQVEFGFRSDKYRVIRSVFKGVLSD